MKNAALKSFPSTKRRVPHISLVFREMWETTALDQRSLGRTHKRLRFVASHFSRKTSEIWGTRRSAEGKGLKEPC